MKKKKGRKIISILSLLLVTTFVLLGCGSDGNYAETAAYDSYDVGMEMSKNSEFGYLEEVAYEESYEEAVPMDADDGRNETAEADQVSDNRKLIKRTNLSLETLEFDTFIQSLDVLIEETGGYVEYLDQSNQSYYSEYGRYASYTIRIPQASLDSFVEQVGEMASVQSKNESVTDVTLEYVDIESKKEMYEIEQENLLELLDSATTIEDMIIVESRLTEVRYQLESMESQLRTYDNLVDYATITIYIDEVVRLEPTEEATAGERIRIGFANSIDEVQERMQNFAINFVIALPIIIYNLVILAIVGGIIFLLVKIIIRANKKKKAKRQKMMDQKTKSYQEEQEKSQAQEKK